MKLTRKLLIFYLGIRAQIIEIRSFASSKIKTTGVKLYFFSDLPEATICKSLDYKQHS